MKLLLHSLALLLVLLAVEAKKKKSGTCEPISVKTCTSPDVRHTHTSLPITIKDGISSFDGVTTFKSQKKALRKTRPYVSLLRKGKDCKKFLKPFACAVYVPACDDSEEMRTIPPCRELCYQAQTNCREGFQDLGVEWPSEFNCQLFPMSTEDPQCVSAYSISEKDVKVVDSQIRVEVSCNYEVKPQEQPKWIKNERPVEEINRRYRTEVVNGRTATLVIEGYTDLADAGVYSCLVESDYFGKSVELKDIEQSALEVLPPIEPPSCEAYQVPCPSGDCVPFSALCDGVQDCPSGLDEMDCTVVDEGAVPTGECPPYTVACPMNPDICISPSAFCDGNEDCPSGMDEMMNCTDTGSVLTGECPLYTVACPMNPDICISPSAFCDGNEDCPSGMDEMMDCTDTGDGSIPTLMTGECPPYTIACPINPDICVPLTAFCDGKEDCPSGMDEMMNCTDTDTGSIPTGMTGECPPYTVACPMNPDICISPSDFCNGNEDCPSGMDEMMNCTDTEPMCEPITVPECSVGLDYTTAMTNYPLGLSNSDKQSVLSSLSVIFESTCGRFFRPFMCSAFLPPCRERVVLPCRELCFLAVKKCVETFDGVLSAEDLMASGGSGGNCDMMPSEADGQCYNVEVVSIGEVMGSGSEDGIGISVECTYNLMPGMQPVWTDPSGNEIKTGSRKRVKTVNITETVTALMIDNFSAKRFGGTYTCSADGFSATVEL
ncbi:uncharacterized protein [Asterias amurensis]|uniref:uncharacterized protein isoform X2 n=1 Tax=Asterias amurensis TaxID=7602 RepID=UPI003AB2B8B3